MGLKKIGKATAPRSFGTGGTKLTPKNNVPNTLNNAQSTYKSTSRKENAFDKLFDLANEVVSSSLPKSAPKFTLPTTAKGMADMASAIQKQQADKKERSITAELAFARRTRAGGDVIQDLQKKQRAALEHQFASNDSNFLKDLGWGIGYGAERIGAGLLGAAEGVSDFVGSTGSKALEYLTSFGYSNPNDVSEFFRRQAENYLNTSPTSAYQQSIEDRYQPTDLQRALGDVNETVAAMFPSIGAAALTGGGSAAGQLVSGASGVSKVLTGSNLGKTIMGVQAAGGGAQEAYQGGADIGQALAFGAASGLLETTTEALVGGIPGLGKGAASELVGKVISNPIVQKAVDIVGEGGEEAISAIVTPYLQRAIYDPSAENASLEEIAQNAVMGMVAAGVLQGGIELPSYLSARMDAGRNVNTYDAFTQQQASILEQIANEMAAERVSQIHGFERQTTQPQVQTTVPAQPRMQAQNQQQTQAQQSTALLDQLRQQTSTLSNRQAEQVLSDRQAVATLQQDAGLDLSAQTTLAQRRAAVKQSFEQYAAQQQQAQADQNQADMMNSLGENGKKAFVSAVRQTGDADATYPEFARAYAAGLSGSDQAADLSPAAQAAYYAGQNDASTRAEVKDPTMTAGFTESEYSGDLSESDRAFYDVLGKATGTKITVTAPTGEGGYNGYYQNGEIRIAADAEEPGQVVVAHEATHRLQEIAPEAYTKFRDYAVAAVAGQGGADALISAYQSRYADVGVTLTRDAAMDEIAADYAQRLMIDEEAIRRVVSDDRSLAQKFVDTIKDLIQRVKQAFSGKEARAEIKHLEKARDLWLDALRTGNTQVSRLRGNRADATMEKTQYSMKEGTDYGRENEIGRGSQKSGQTGYGQGLDGKGEQVSGGVRRNLSDASGRYGGVDPSFGADPVRTWANGHTLEPAKGSVSYAEQQTAVEYGVPSFVVDDATWTENKGSDPAFSAGGQIYFRETLPENRRGMFAPHELTHVMRQVGYQPYLDFVDRTPEMLNMSSSFTLLLLDHVAKHQGTNTSNADPTRLYDELNATIYGHYAAGKTKDLSGPLHQAFYDFDAYIAELSDLHERFKLENGEKAQYSLKGTSQLQRQVQNLQERNAYLKEQMKRSTSIKTDRKKTAAYAKRLLKAYESQYGSDALTSDLLSIYDEIANAGSDVDMDSLTASARDVAGRILEQSVREDAELYNEYSALRNYLRTTKINVPKSIHADLDMVGGYNQFRKSNMGRMKLSSSDGASIDTVYQELAQQYPGLFDETAYTNPADQLINMADVLDGIQPIIENPYSSDMEMATRFVASEILESYFDIPQQKPTFADRQQARVESAKAAGNRRVAELREANRQNIAGIREQNRERISALRASNQQQIAQLREQGRQQVKAAIQKERTRRAEQIQALKEKFSAKETSSRERRAAREVRSKIERHVRALSTRLLDPTDSRNVPDELRPPVAALLEAINLESNYTFDPDTLHEVIRKDGKSGGMTGKHLAADDARGVATKRTKAFIDLRNAYQQIIKDGVGDMVIDPALLGDQAGDFQGNFDKVISMYDKRLADMSLSELETVLQTVRAVEFSISTAGKNLAQSKFAGTVEWAKAMQSENAGKVQRSSTKRHWTLDLLTPITYFSRFGDSGVEVYRMLRNAQDRQQQMITDIRETTREIVSPADARKYRYETHEFVTDGGQELTLTTAQIMSIYELSKRKQAQGHLLSGGIYQPEVPGTKIRRGTEAIHLTEGDLAAIVGTLTDKQAKVADELQKVMATTLADWGNEASMKAYGYKKFTGADYWPISVAREGVKTTVENSGMNTRSISNIGLAKATVPKASNPLNIEDAFSTFTQHAGDMTDYAAYLLPMEDISRLFNFKFKDKEGNYTHSINDILNRVGGANSDSYWTTLMEDIQNGTAARTDSQFSAGIQNIIGKAKGAAVGANLRVVAQQPTAFFRAAAILSPADLSRGVAGAPTKGSGWKKAMKWAPIAQRKQIGGFEIGNGVRLETELFGDLSKGGKRALNKLDDISSTPAAKVDQITWGRIWNACEWQISKNKSLAKGSDEYYQATAKLFTRVIDESQVVDGVLQRSQIMRSNSALNKMATSFMGEPTMSLNMMMRAWDTMRYETDPKKRNALRRKFARAGTALVVSGVVNAMVQSLVDAERDKDPDKKYWGRVFSAFTGLTGEEETPWDKAIAVVLNSNVSGNINPLGQIPYVKDVLSLLQGYDVTRMDADAVGDFITAGENVVKNIGGNGPRTPVYAAKELLNAGAKVFGVSIGNLWRDASGIVNAIAVGTDNTTLMYEMAKAGYNLSNTSNKSRFLDIAFRARQTGDTETYNKIASDLISSGTVADMDEFEKAMASRLKNTTSFADSQAETQKKLESKVTSSKLYRSLDSVTQEKAIDKVEAYAYAKQMEKDNPGYDLPSTYNWVEKADAGASVGLTPDEYILFDLAYNMLKSNEKEGGLSKQEKAIDLLESMNLSDAERSYLFGTKYTSDKNNPWK